ISSNKAFGEKCFNLKSSVEQGRVCSCGGADQGVTVRNGHSLSSSYNADMRHHSCAICPVAVSPIE
ncbi:MAG: hypothetical protein V3U78_02935, partial [Thiotrichaceae bacterium]